MNGDAKRPLRARAAALLALRDIDANGTFAGEALDRVLGAHRLESRDRGLATELVYGVTRRRATLDWYLSQVSSRPLAQMTPWVRNILRLSAYQLLYLERVPAPAVIHEAVELGKRHGHGGVAGFINAVLRALLTRRSTLALPDRAADPVAHLAVVASAPAWLAAAWLEEYGFDEALSLLSAMNAPSPLTVRANPLRTERAELMATLAAAGIPTRPTPWSPSGLVLGELAGAGGGGGGGLPGLPAFRQGLFTAQDESSMLVAPILAPVPGQLVVDVAAAPGGKTTHLAELMGDRGRVVAMDPQPDRLTLVEENCERLGLTCVQTACADGRTAGRLFADAADAVLCDVPCSGLGTLGRRPDARWRKQPDDIPALTTLQREILASAAAAVRPGGILVYSTCTLARPENQEMVAWFLAAHGDFRADDLRPYLPAGLRPDAAAAGTQITLLPHRHGTDGFFVARFRRR